MTINEGMIDKRTQQAVTFYGKSEMSLKLTAYAAGRVVGKYDGTTVMIAKQIKRSPSTVENLAHAFWLYDEMRYLAKPDVVKRVRELWRKLPISHWWLAWDSVDNAYDAYKLLDNAEKHGWSGRDMLREYKADYEREHGAPPPVAIGKVYGRAVNVVTDVLARFSEVDSRVAEWAQQGLNLFAELGIVEAE